jgi:hypothetical protein
MSGSNIKDGLNLYMKQSLCSYNFPKVELPLKYCYALV